MYHTEYDKNTFQSYNTDSSQQFYIDDSTIFAHSKKYIYKVYVRTRALPTGRYVQPAHAPLVLTQSIWSKYSRQRSPNAVVSILYSIIIFNYNIRAESKFLAAPNCVPPFFWHFLAPTHTCCC